MQFDGGKKALEESMCEPVYNLKYKKIFIVEYKTQRSSKINGLEFTKIKNSDITKMVI